ncbi:hypothetical protein BCY84_15869 [Trypanosoma cruzi cruzi]|uniref:Uncharacterized protein n=1 Tax=Trypanosoma cruzi TaxID=5693 RepID=A0A2V2UMR3_TRYCR|nr:hypothetical protein BCY84_15869 [Trypanosoma cruzi cruzi]PWU84402.1 hypothetical protein C4B63_230g11 [Trypanosoma cruzi]
MFLLCLRDYSSLRFRLYDWMIVPMRSMWYREVLLQCPMDASVLDVCVRTASSLIANRDVVRSKKLIVTGVDYDAGYVRAAQDNIIKYGLEKQVNIVHSSTLDDTTSRFDVIYFSDSSLTMPKRLDVLKNCCRMLRGSTINGSPCLENGDDGGCVLLFTQTLEKPTVNLYVLPLVKRLLRFLTTIDFGGTTCEEEFLSVLKHSELRVVSLRVMNESWFYRQVMVVAKPLK